MFVSYVLKLDLVFLCSSPFVQQLALVVDYQSAHWTEAQLYASGGRTPRSNLSSAAI